MMGMLENKVGIVAGAGQGIRASLITSQMLLVDGGAAVR